MYSSILQLEWVLLTLIVRNRYRIVKEIISTSIQLPEHLQCTLSVNFEGETAEHVAFKSIMVFRQVRENHATMNGYFNLTSITTIGISGFWLLNASYNIWFLVPYEMYIRLVISIGVILAINCGIIVLVHLFKMRLDNEVMS